MKQQFPCAFTVCSQFRDIEWQYNFPPEAWMFIRFLVKIGRKSGCGRTPLITSCRSSSALLLNLTLPGMTPTCNSGRLWWNLLPSNLILLLKPIYFVEDSMSVSAAYNNIENFFPIYIRPTSILVLTPPLKLGPPQWRRLSLVNERSFARQPWNRHLNDQRFRTQEWIWARQGTIYVLPGARDLYFPPSRRRHELLTRESMILQAEFVLLSNRSMRAPALKNDCNKCWICASLGLPRADPTSSQCVVTNMRCLAVLSPQRSFKKFGGGLVQRLSWMFRRYKMPVTLSFLWLCCILGQF